MQNNINRTETQIKISIVIAYADTTEKKNEHLQFEETICSFSRQMINFGTIWRDGERQREPSLQFFSNVSQILSHASILRKICEILVFM